MECLPLCFVVAKYLAHFIWGKAVEIQDALYYNEPPSWYYTSREALGFAHLK